MTDKVKHFLVNNIQLYEVIYYLYLLIEKIYMFLFWVMWILPIKKNKIVFCSTKGKRYGDNPLHISDSMRGKGYDIVWLLRDCVEENIPADIRRVRYSVLREIYELATARVWVDCNTKNSGTLKRKKQLYIQTWHGSYGLKKIGSDLGEKLGRIDERYYKKNAKIIDLMVSNSKRTSEVYRRALWYRGEILECGSPRNDIMFCDHNECVKRVRKIFNLKNQRIVMYAPTYRKNYSIDKYKLDYNKLSKILSNKYGGEWTVLVRLHPNNLGDDSEFMEYDDNIKNATKYSSMQDLLVSADILITDYSSCMFDFATTGKPCFLYATDVDEYKKEVDYYFDISKLPFPLAENNEEIEKNIMEFDEAVYNNKLEELFDQVGLCETGCASQKVVDYIEKWMVEN